MLAEKQAAEPGRWDTVVLVAPNESFDSERSVELGTLTLQLHHLPGHTPDCIVGFIPERGVLLAGDTVETPCPVIPADSPLPEWIAGLRRWADDPHVRLVVPAHGPTGGRELLAQNIAYLESIAGGKAIAPPARSPTSIATRTARTCSGARRRPDNHRRVVVHLPSVSFFRNGTPSVIHFGSGAPFR